MNRSHLIDFSGGAAAEVIKPQPVPETPATVEGDAKDGEPEPFPINCLPGAAGDMARAICETQGVPESLAGAMILGFVSASTGAGLRVQSLPDTKTRANLFLLLSGDSGTGKSKAFRLAAKPFQEFEAELVETWLRESKPDLEAEQDILEEEIKSLKRDAGKAEGMTERDELRAKLAEKKRAFEETKGKLQAPVLSVEDVTTQELARLLQFRGECLASLSADAGDIINNVLGRYNSLSRTDESLYLKSFSGDFSRVDRKTSESVMLEEPCLSVLWATQPHHIDELFQNRGLAEGGLLARMLCCHTNCQPLPIDRNRGGIPEDVSESYGALIRELLEAFRTARDRITISPTQEAREALDNHFNGLVARRRGELKDVTSFAARWTEQAWRIAVCLHAGEHGRRAGEHSLSVETARAAIRIADWFAGEQLAILHAGREAKRRDTRQAVLSLLTDKPQGITPRDVQRNHLERKAEDSRALLENMADAGQLRRVEREAKQGGRDVRDFGYVKA